MQSTLTPITTSSSTFSITTSTTCPVAAGLSTCAQAATAEQATCTPTLGPTCSARCTSDGAGIWCGCGEGA